MVSKFTFKDRPASSQQVTENLYDRHKLIMQKKQLALNHELEEMAAQRRKFSKAGKNSDNIVQ